MTALNLSVTQAPTAVTIPQIIAATCLHYRIGRQDLLTPSKTRRIARRRQVAMYVARTVHGKPLSLIGRLLGGVDHTTVIQGNRTIAAEIAAGNEDIAAAVVAVTELTMSTTGQNA